MKVFGVALNTILMWATIGGGIGGVGAYTIAQDNSASGGQKNWVGSLINVFWGAFYGIVSVLGLYFFGWFVFGLTTLAGSPVFFFLKGYLGLPPWLALTGGALSGIGFWYLIGPGPYAADQGI